MDKESANAQLVKTQLATEHNLNPEEWGGDTIMVEVSAKTKSGLDKLLDMVLLVADLEELKAETDIAAEGLVIEAHMATGKGPVVGLLVEHGVLRATQFMVAGTVYGKVRTLLDFKGDTMKQAGASTPATVTGFKDLPSFGDRFSVVKNEKAARQLVEKHRSAQLRDALSSNVTGSDLLNLISKSHDSQEANVIVRADVQGSLTSVIDSLKLIDTGEVSARVISSGVGNINENDVRLAASSGAIIYGFNIQLPPAVKRLATREKVSIRNFRVIYELLDDVKLVLEDLLSPEIVDTEVGTLKILGIFRTTKDEIICGGEVLKGKAMPNVLAHVVRNKETIADVEVTKVQRAQQEAKEVFEGEQCGLSVKTTSSKGKLLLEEGDRLEFFTRALKKRTL